jgi:hypothetical protein
VFPFGFIDDPPFTEPDGSKIVSTAEQGGATKVILLRPEVTHERIQYSIKRTAGAFKLISRDIVEDTTNPEAVAFLKQFIGALRGLVLDLVKAQELDPKTRAPWEKANRRMKLIYDEFCDYDKKLGISVGGYGNPPGNDPDRCKILSITEKGKKIVIVVQQPRPTLDNKTGEWLPTLEDWLCQDSSRIHDLYSAGGLTRKVMQYTLLQTNKGLRVSEKIKMYMEGENRFVNYAPLL